MTATPIEGEVRVTWTPELDERVRELYGLGLDDEQIATEIGATFEAIRHRRIRLKLLRSSSDRLAWTPEMERRLRTMREEGYSSDQIADKLGITKRAVVGKAFRLGLPRLPRKLSPKAKEQKRGDHGGGLIRRMMVKAARPAEPYPTIIDDIPAEQRVSFMELSETTCRWPLGDPGTAEFFFCGATPLEGRPYCPLHHVRAYENPGKG